jgi:hypothetical protein
MRKALRFLLVVVSFLSIEAVADGDIAITSFTLDKTNVQTGEAFTVDLRVKNNKPVAAESINLNFASTWPAIAQMRVLSADLPAGWRCSTTSLNCYADSLAGGAEVAITYRIAAPASLRSEPFLVMAHVGMRGIDTNLDNNNAELPLTVQQSIHRADLSIAVSSPPNPIPFDTPVTFAYDVRNNGPEKANDVRVAFYMSLSADRVYEGAGWTCTTDNGVETTCRRASIAANSNAPLSVRFTTPGRSAAVSSQASVFTEEAHFDENTSNNVAYAGVSVGEASEWDRLLAPFPAKELAGANGSRWKTEIRAVIESDHYPRLGPTACGPVEDPCSFPPLHMLFDAAEDLVFEENGPQFVYVGKEDASKLKMVTRVYDASKSATTAGAFVPTARNADFSAQGFSLIAIPVAPESRSTLRIYDAAATDGGEVELIFYGDAETEPFLRTTARLYVQGEQQLVTTALLPLLPAAAELNLSSVVPARYARARVIVRPPLRDQPSQMKLWGFASITNNQTSHVTVVTP